LAYFRILRVGLPSLRSQHRCAANTICRTLSITRNDKVGTVTK
jgi:hypothetical protein